MTRQIVVVGAGGHGREVLDVIEASNAAKPDAGSHLLGVIDDSPSYVNLQRLAERGIAYLGSVASWSRLADRNISYVVGIGSSLARRAVDEQMSAAGFEAATLVHPSAIVGSQVHLAPGVVVSSGVILTTNIIVGRHTHLNFGAAVGHDTRVGDYVMVNPSANISGDCIIDDDVMLGVGSVILQGLRVGRGAIVGASACVVRDVPAEEVAKGVPARWEAVGKLVALPDQRDGSTPGLIQPRPRAANSTADSTVSQRVTEKAP